MNKSMKRFLETVFELEDLKRPEVARAVRKARCIVAVQPDGEALAIVRPGIWRAIRLGRGCEFALESVVAFKADWGSADFALLAVGVSAILRRQK
jgi:hypothetical protein